eukprot:Filipodium_phascolosomae@DN1300_c0_g1_i1.p1
MGNCQPKEEIVVKQLLKTISPRGTWIPMSGTEMTVKNAELSQTSNVDDKTELSLREFAVQDVLLNVIVTADIPFHEDNKFDVPITMDVVKSLASPEAFVSVKQVWCDEPIVRDFLSVPAFKMFVADSVADLVNDLIAKRLK